MSATSRTIRCVWAICCLSLACAGGSATAHFPLKPSHGARTSATRTGAIAPTRNKETTEHATSVIDLQSFRETTSIPTGDAGEPEGTATLVNLAPHVNAWFLLRVKARGASTTDYHLENANPAGAHLVLDQRHRSGIVIVTGEGRVACDLWSGGEASALSAARRSRRTYVPLCDDKLFLRNRTRGHRTYKEWASDFLRDHVWRGDRITGFVKDTFFRDAALATSAARASATPAASDPEGPPGAIVDPAIPDCLIAPVGLGLRLDHGSRDGLPIGRWYRVHGSPGVFASAVQPRFVGGAIAGVRPLDPVEAEALVYSVAFDLSRFDLGLVLGTDHPRVDWSERIPAAQRDQELPGPDGFGTIDPLVRTGMLNPVEAGRAAATFVGGFKRIHGAFHSGPLAKVNHGSHYGFVENGVVLSRLQPGLATVVVYDDGTVQLKTWSRADELDMARIRHARQNGVAVVEYDPQAMASRPGPLVGLWGAGNWSGSADEKLRTVRGGLCLQEAEGRRFLTYSYFSSATPSTMARVFQAYGCRYAMLLDMNALEHTYLAVYHGEGERMVTQHLVDGMSVLDHSGPDGYLPRFIAVADNRDFFYVLRRPTP